VERVQEAQGGCERHGVDRGDVGIMQEAYKDDRDTGEGKKNYMLLVITTVA
jgi:hypothetical protein